MLLTLFEKIADEDKEVAADEIFEQLKREMSTEHVYLKPISSLMEYDSTGVQYRIAFEIRW